MAYPILDTINSIEDFKALEEERLPDLCEELRAFLVENVSQTGGHLASSLGAIELIVALHRVFDTPKDKLIFDVGHQSYVHKILTGRKDAFPTLRQSGGISGFPKRCESVHDAFDTGHASTAISAALGYARGMRLQQQEGMAIALVGDGAMTGGLSFEAMDDAGDEQIPLLVVLNDNEMSIARNVGGLNRSLNMMRSGKSYHAFKRAVVRTLDTGRFGKWLSGHMELFKNRIKRFLLPNLPFEELGFLYIGPLDGHDVHKMIRYLKRAKAVGRPVLLHALTQKGKGYPFAVDDPEKFHGIAPFSIMTGKVNGEKPQSCSEVFGETLCELAEENSAIVAITAAMTGGTGLSGFREKFPNRFYDVGIAEGHAVTMAAGLAAAGMRPVVALYSSFLQRGFDQLLHDVCLQNLPVVIAVDRAGLVGEDGETHQGIYDPAYLSVMPNLTVYSPASNAELRAMLRMAIERKEPSVVRYNRGALPELSLGEPITYGQWEIVCPLKKTTIVTTGVLLPLCTWVAKKNGVGLVHARFLQPLDEQILQYFRENGIRLLVVEENTVSLGAKLALRCNPCRVRSVALPTEAISHASVTEQRDRYGFNEQNLTEQLLKLMEEE